MRHPCGGPGSGSGSTHQGPAIHRAARRGPGAGTRPQSTSWWARSSRQRARHGTTHDVLACWFGVDRSTIARAVGEVREYCPAALTAFHNAGKPTIKSSTSHRQPCMSSLVTIHPLPPIRVEGPHQPGSSALPADQVRPASSGRSQERASRASAFDCPKRNRVQHPPGRTVDNLIQGIRDRAHVIPRRARSVRWCTVERLPFRSAGCTP
ncbi:transposase family protein [Streptomyces hayashii]|uniref:transposase family protein n=1 Tax=Streptomyces hayashii TaxID=2839966 RepID=UPI00403C8AF5